MNETKPPASGHLQSRGRWGGGGGEKWYRVWGRQRGVRERWAWEAGQESLTTQV